jgi:L-amino acid N-acyltransferase YncA
MAVRFRCRPATAEDADAIAAVFSTSYRLLTFLPPVRTDEERRRFIETVILKMCKVIVAEDETGIASFLALNGQVVRLIYTRPDRIGRGAGSLLLEAAKNSGVEALEL